MLNASPPGAGGAGALVLRGGRVIDPASGTDGVADVVVAGGRIAAVGPGLLDPGAELSVRTDKVSIEYRRWLRELATAALAGPEAYSAALGLDRPGPAVHGPITCANSTVR